MKITSIKAQVKNSERASIFIDGKYAFSLSLSELVAEKLRHGLELSENDSKRLKKLSEDGKLKARVLEWLLNRPRSVRELKDYLYRKKVEPEQVTMLIDYFTERGYLDERKFADWLCEFRRRNGKSERAIRSELAGKGLDRSLIDEALGAGKDDELDRLRGLAEKKLRLSRYRNDHQKLMQYLVRQGFRYEDVKSVLSGC